MMKNRCHLYLLALLVASAWSATPRSATGQISGGTVQVISGAEQVFDQALQAFDGGDYGMAYRRFRLVYTSYPLNVKTTAALLMGGKALFRQGRYQDAIDLLEEFVRAYPTSSYVDEAERTLRLAEEIRSLRVSAPDTTHLGVALPLEDGDDALTQAMFNGIRLAVSEHNDRFGEQRPVQMVFRNSGGTEATARAAAAELVDADVVAIIGPLYSEAAEAAGEVAERAETILIAPLATEESVSTGRRFVFQANPTWTVRGQMLARFADDRFGHERYGIIAELGDSYSERMAEGFQEEITRMGASVLYYRLIEQGSEWYDLDGLLPATAWDSLEAVYLPISGQDADQFASAALSALARAGVRPQVFGSAEWGNVTALSLASDFNTVYTTGFHLRPGDAAVEQFRQEYSAIAGSGPEGETGRVAYAGYDVARFLLNRIMQSGDAPLVEAFANAPWYQGLGSRLFFEGGNVNRGLFYMRYRPGKIDLLR